MSNRSIWTKKPLRPRSSRQQHKVLLRSLNPDKHSNTIFRGTANHSKWPLYLNFLPKKSFVALRLPQSDPLTSLTDVVALVGWLILALAVYSINLFVQVILEPLPTMRSLLLSTLLRLKATSTPLVAVEVEIWQRTPIPSQREGLVFNPIFHYICGY